jgi:alkaline phosphatase D
VSKIDLGGLNFPLFDITSSGLTHSAINNTKEPNALRVGSLVNQKNFGLIRFKECNQQIEVELKGVENVRYNIEKLVF